MNNKTLLNKNNLNNAPTDEAFILSRDPHKAMREMMATIDELRGIYESENDALSRGDTKRFIALQDSKLIVARQYQLGAEQMLARRDEMNVISDELRTSLKERQEQFSDIARDNLRALNRARKGVKRLGNRIMETARKAARTEQRVKYGSSGHLEENDGRVSIGVNESA